SSRQPCETTRHPRPGPRKESTDHCHSARWSISHVCGSERDLASRVGRMIPSAFRFACSSGVGGWISGSRPSHMPHYFNPEEACHFSVANQDSFRQAYQASLTLFHSPFLVLGPLISGDLWERPISS